jgi:hypothetical protein
VADSLDDFLERYLTKDKTIHVYLMSRRYEIERRNFFLD